MFEAFFIAKKMSSLPCIESYLKNANIDDVPVGTVHAFQDDQKDVILFSTVISKKTSKETYSWLKNNHELINVAISRARDRFVMIADEVAIENLSEDKNDIRELKNYIKSEGKTDVTNVAPESFALGTRHISTESEKDLAMTVNHALSIVNNQCYIREQQSIKSLFTDGAGAESLFYSGHFDIVIFEKTFSGERIRMAIELNGPEHLSDENVKERDKRKLEFCKKHNFKLYSLSRDCARDYDLIKKVLLNIVGGKK